MLIHQLKLELLETPRLADFFSVFSVLSVWAILISGATSLLGWAKKRIWRKSVQAERWKRTSLSSFFTFARPHNRESRKELNWAWFAGLPIFSVRVKYNFSRMTLLKICTTSSLINVKRKYIFVYFFNCQAKINGFEIAFCSKTKDRIPFFADLGKIELRSFGRG